ncbi:RbsD/FucU family protein [Raoultella sp. XY-1]|jgi:L-fucose mutarotase|uniref:RbsD/FucU family protein n=1 Tax=Raoultella TaxID=160674 RepID=UPI001907C5F2|nr:MULTISPECIES: RbsD/FucU family protein [Raoultella]MCX3411290.1 RbsD/FucU family protein [Raoultella ornithinolytica]MDX7495672.1 RbsD/FucU family protein [Raoultella ornithinolytica]QQN42705.1 RbsD/FucU family protein [Raoultella sp. XY-1]HCU0889606.1 RbsD/FucU family protein [Raoultella ornithinolytica]HDH7845624.1 RbsD/FucU family protein [Raoultella ornithinolytica]
MIKTEIIHPDLLQALAQCGHKANILIADANYSFLTNSSPRARIIYLNFSPGLISSVVILQKMLGYINIEKAVLMSCPDDFDNTIAREYRTLLAESSAVEYVTREAFYALAKSSDTLLVVASGETRRFANILLTVGPTLL